MRGVAVYANRGICVTTTPDAGLQLRSTVTDDGHLELILIEVPVAQPSPDEVVIRVEASPINPSDLGLLLAGADLATLDVQTVGEHPQVRATIEEGVLRSLAGRRGASMTGGNEGAGTVVSVGSDWCLVIRQSADCARHGGDHAHRRSYGARPHGCGVESWSDARSPLPARSGAVGQHRPASR